mgnify:CR=1 FL=1
MNKFQDTSIWYFNVITNQNDNLQLSSSADVIDLESNQNRNDLERDCFGPNAVIKLNLNARESQAFQYYRMLMNVKVSEIINIQIKNSVPNQFSSPSLSKLPSLKSSSSSPQKSTVINNDNENSIPTPALTMRSSVMRRPVAQLDLIMMRKKQAGSRAAKASMLIFLNIS